jgi:iron complex transport system permease protein
LALIWIAALLFAPLLGSQSLDLSAVLDGRGQDSTILWRLRLPRVLLALAVGGALAASGLAFQTVLRNPLAEPYTLGIASGAALGAVLAIRGGAENWLGLPAVGAASFLGALMTAWLVAGFARRGRTGAGHAEASTLLLAGVALSLTCQAVILLLQFFAEPYQTLRMVRWTLGGLSVVGFGEVAWIWPWTVAATILLLVHRWDLNVLVTGDELAASRGVDVGRLRLRVLLIGSAVVGASVAVAGPIGFVGLMVPHLLRRLLGQDHALLLPGAILGGGAFLVLCDLAARTVLAPAELPVGILTAALGGPFFLLLLLRRRQH